MKILRKFLSVILTLSLLASFVFLQKGSIPSLKASSSIYQGDLILTGNNVTTIEGRFDINGSIIVEDNATLVLKDAFLNLTLTDFYQHYITLRNPSNGNPRLFAYNSTITSSFFTFVYLLDNSIATIDNSTISSLHFKAMDDSNLSIFSGSNVGLEALDSSIVSIYNSTISSMWTRGSSKVLACDSEVIFPFIEPTSVNCTISNLEPGFIGHWSFITNCSVNIPSGGFTPNVTFVDMNVGSWSFGFYGYSNVSIRNSKIHSASGQSYSVISLKSTTCSNINAYSSSHFLIDDSDISSIWARHSSKTCLLNSTYFATDIRDSAEVHASWYLDVLVIDSIGQNVPSANVTVTYPNATVAEPKLTDANGWTRLTLTEKLMNTTGEYPVGNYSIEATYGAYSDQAVVNMTDNKQITLTLEDFLLPSLVGEGWGRIRIKPEHSWVWGTAKLYKIDEEQIELVISHEGEEYSKVWDIIHYRERKHSETYFGYHRDHGPLVVTIYRQWSMWRCRGRNVRALGLIRNQ